MATVQFNLRVPEELKRQVDEAAQISGRSINAEAAYRLEQSFLEDSSNALRGGVHVNMDSEWFKATGLTADEFAKYVRLAILSGLTDDKESK